jgi:preprotein translocase subunit SecG
MNAFLTLIVITQVVSALAIIGLVLLQHGKGADMGAAFGSGASGSLFGATGSSNFLSKSTGFAAATFFGATLALAFIANKPVVGGGGVMENLPAVGAPATQGPVNQIPGAEQRPAAAPREQTPPTGGSAAGANQIPN